jgi:hypothetical protein
MGRLLAHAIALAARKGHEGRGKRARRAAGVFVRYAVCWRGLNGWSVGGGADACFLCLLLAAASAWRSRAALTPYPPCSMRAASAGGDGAAGNCGHEGRRTIPHREHAVPRPAVLLRRRCASIKLRCSSTDQTEPAVGGHARGLCASLQREHAARRPHDT